MNRKTLLLHIDNLIRFDVGEKVLVLAEYGSGLPKVGMIKEIRIEHNYDYNIDENAKRPLDPERYAINYVLEHQSNDYHGMKGKHLRKFNPTIAKNLETVLNLMQDLYK